MEADILAILEAITELGGRVWAVTLPEKPTLPAATYQYITGIPEVTQGGPDNLTFKRVQISCFGETYGDAKTAGRAVRDALSGVFVEGGSLQASFVDNHFDDKELETNLYKDLTDIIAWGKEQ
jgi:hypothetical protein